MVSCFDCLGKARGEPDSAPSRNHQNLGLTSLDVRKIFNDRRLAISDKIDIQSWLSWAPDGGRTAALIDDQKDRYSPSYSRLVVFNGVDASAG